MRPLNIFERFETWIYSLPNRFCNHEFEEDFSNEIESKWERCSGTLFCKKCGEIFPYHFKFRDED